MLRKVKVLENNVRDLYSICNNEFETKINSQCYECCENLAEAINTLKKEVYFKTDVPKECSDKTANIYETLCHLESDVVELMNTINPIEVKGLRNRTIPTVGSCLVCQKRTQRTYNAGKSSHYLPSKGWNLKTGSDCLGNVDSFYEKLPSTSVQNLSVTKKGHRYRHPSITFKSESSPSSSSSSRSTVWVEEYYEAPKKRFNKYRIVREKLPFSIKKSINYPVTKERRRSSPKQRIALLKEMRISPTKYRPKLVKEKRISSPSKHRQSQSMPQIRKKYDPRDFRRSVDHSHNMSSRGKKKKKYNETVKEGKQERRPSEFYFVKRTKGPLHSGLSINERKSPNTKYIVSRLRRISKSDSFNNGKSRTKSVHTKDKEKVYSELDVQRGCHSDTNSSETSLDSKSYKAKRRRRPEQGLSRKPFIEHHPSYSESAIFSNWSYMSNKKPFKFRRSYDDSDNSRERKHFQTNKNGTHKQQSYNLETKHRLINDRSYGNRKKKVKKSSDGSETSTQRQHNQTNKNGTQKMHNYNFETNYLAFNCRSSGNRSYSSSSCSSCYELVDLFYGSSRSFKPKDRNKKLKRNCSNQFTECQKSCPIPKTSTVLSMYAKKTPIFESSVGIKPTPNDKLNIVNENMSSSSWFQEGIRGKHLGGQNRDSQNEVNVYQIHGKIGSNPFLTNGKNKTSTVASMSPFKRSSSLFSKHRKSEVEQLRSSEAIIHNINYPDIKDTLLSDNKTNTAPSVVRKPDKKLSKVKSNPKLPEVGSKISNLIKNVSLLKLKRQHSKNSVLDVSESSSYLKQSEPNVHKQPSYESLNKHNIGVVGNKQQIRRSLARPLKMSHINEANQNNLRKSVDGNKTSGKGLTYSFNYKREKRQDFKCNQWPSTYSLNHFSSNCETILSEESIDLSEHKLSGLKIHKKYHTSNIPTLSTEESNINGDTVMMTPKSKDFRPNPLHSQVYLIKGHKNAHAQNILETKSSSVPQVYSDASRHFDWKQIVKEMEEF